MQLPVIRILLYTRDLREKRDERDGGEFEVRSSRFSELRTRNFSCAPVAHVSLTFHERYFTGPLTPLQHPRGCSGPEHQQGTCDEDGRIGSDDHAYQQGEREVV